MELIQLAPLMEFSGLKALRLAGSRQLRMRALALTAVLLLIGSISLAAWPLGSSVQAQTVATLMSTKPLKTLGDKEVLIGAYIRNIQAINPETNSFLADVYIWLRWNDRTIQPYKSMEFVNLFEAWQLMSWKIQEEPILQPDGSLYYLTHYQGAFNSILSLKNYPFQHFQNSIH